MRITDIMANIPDDEMTKIRKEAEQLTETNPLNDNGEPIDWLRVIVEDWWQAENAMPNGWFQWWDD